MSMEGEFRSHVWYLFLLLTCCRYPFFRDSYDSRYNFIPGICCSHVCLLPLCSHPLLLFSCLLFPQPVASARDAGCSAITERFEL